MMHVLAVKLGRWIANKRTGRIPARLYRYIRTMYLNSNNYNYFDIQKNGEAWLVQAACRRLPIKTVMDVGANHGEWLALVVKYAGEAEIIACEPQHKLAKMLSEQYKTNTRVEIIAAGVGDDDGEMQLHCYQEDDLANAFGWQHQHKSEIIRVPIHNGMQLLKQRDWQSLDLLKVDVEGMELSVLKGFSEMIQSQKIGLVQFEFGAFSIQTRVLLKDFYDLFGDNYRIGRLMPNGIDFTDYDFHCESSEFANYVACRKDWIEKLVSN